MKSKKAQTLIEYAIVAGIVAIVLATMGTPFKRTIQKIMKSVADAIGYQSKSEQAANHEEGYLDFAETNAWVTTNTAIDETQGIYSSYEQEMITTKTNALTNLGLTEE
ncbi:MAG: Flp family type IVb pilin [Candidatus Omnitrophica bacterium]|nr:Flp family type IVb pilin [Candidatus Omnitrophota bacterium]